MSLPPDREKAIQHEFDSFCKLVAKHEARNYYKEMKLLKSKEGTFSELSTKELELLQRIEQHFHSSHYFIVLDECVVVNDSDIADALEALPTQKRNIILLSFFREFTDEKIGCKLNIPRSTVQYQKKATLKLLKAILNDGE